MTKPTPFTKILIANRGEIALRIIRSARAHGYRTVAVYSSADAQARHVFEADQAVWIGESPPSQSYLNIASIIEAARAIGSDAVHPGYGFLAENEAFARACREAELVFIGPSPESIVAMGNKAGAKKLMSEAGVPCVPGYQGDDQGEDRLAREADRIGYPVMIKATAGGGGRGMRLIAKPSEFVDALRSARSEALNAFGDATVILERAISNPRHIEIQILGDRHGQAIHLGERDCSVQRRHQKLIEEAPSPRVSPVLRERMGAVAVAATKAIGYEGAGTLEFLLDGAGDFYFMEMNTRLQVEHPVTEAITGVDLVELQLRIAAGDPLPLSQDDVKFRGHAIEVRLCAEDAARDFMPQSGVVAFWAPGDGLRCEHALKSGAEIPPYYDSMIAKIIAYGATREEACRKLILGLEDTTVLGVRTNQGFLRNCLTHPVFAQGDATTSFIGENLPELLRRNESSTERARALAAALLIETAPHGARRGQGRRLFSALPVSLRFEINGETLTASLTDLGGRRHLVTIGEHRRELDIVDVGAHAIRFICDGVMESAAYLRDGPRLIFRYQGEAYEVADTTRAATARQEGAGAGDANVRASMNGRVVATFAEVGAAVEAGAPILALEAMKMEHLHVAAVAGLLKALHVAKGDQVTAGRVLAEIEPAATPGAN
jgi:geranyl-CoA carboxylase alpha subunit